MRRKGGRGRAKESERARESLQDLDLAAVLVEKGVANGDRGKRNRVQSYRAEGGNKEEVAVAARKLIVLIHRLIA